MSLHGKIIPIRETIVPGTDRAISETFRELPDSYLLDLGAIPDFTTRRGQTFVHASIMKGTQAAINRTKVLLQDYISAGLGIQWPGGIIRSSLEGPGILRSVTGTDPAAGAEISETVPTNARWKIWSIAATLVSSAAVASRAPMLDFDDGTTRHGRWGPSTVQTASQTVVWSGPIPSLSSTSVLYNQWLGIYVELFGGWRIRTVTENLQAGDNWAAPQMLVEEWIEE